MWSPYHADYFLSERLRAWIPSLIVTTHTVHNAHVTNYEAEGYYQINKPKIPPMEPLSRFLIGIQSCPTSPLVLIFFHTIRGQSEDSAKFSNIWSSGWGPGCCGQCGCSVDCGGDYSGDSDKEKKAQPSG